MRKKYKKIYVAEYERIEEWSSGQPVDVINGLGEDEFMLLITNGEDYHNSNPTAEKAKNILVTERKGKCIPRDEDNLQDTVEKLLSSISANILNFRNKEDGSNENGGNRSNVYFILADWFYDQILKSWDANTECSFIKLPSMNVQKMKRQSTEEKAKKKSVGNDEDIFAAAQECVYGSNESQSENREKNADEGVRRKGKKESQQPKNDEKDKNETLSSQEQKDEEDDSSPGSDKAPEDSKEHEDAGALNDSKPNGARPGNKSDTRASSDSKPNGARPGGKPKGSTGKPRNSKRDDSENTKEEEKTLRQLEREIFGTQVTDNKVERVYTELDDSKAKVTDDIFERFCGRLKIFISGDKENLKNYHYTSFMTTLLRSENYQDFLNSWGAVRSFDVVITDENYVHLKREAEYYVRVCDDLYGDDEWEDD